MKHYEESRKVLEIVRSNLHRAEDQMAKLLEQQAEIDARVEDMSRVIMGLKRTEKTLSAGIPAEPVTMPRTNTPFPDFPHQPQEDGPNSPEEVAA